MITNSSFPTLTSILCLGYTRWRQRKHFAEGSQRRKAATWTTKRWRFMVFVDTVTHRHAHIHTQTNTQTFVQTHVQRYALLDTRREVVSVFNRIGLLGLLRIRAPLWLSLNLNCVLKWASPSFRGCFRLSTAFCRSFPRRHYQQHKQWNCVNNASCAQKYKGKLSNKTK